MRPADRVSLSPFEVASREVVVESYHTVVSSPLALGREPADYKYSYLRSGGARLPDVDDDRSTVVYADELELGAS